MRPRGLKSMSVHYIFIPHMCGCTQPSRNTHTQKRVHAKIEGSLQSDFFRLCSSRKYCGQLLDQFSYVRWTQKQSTKRQTKADFHLAQEKLGRAVIPRQGVLLRTGSCSLCKLVTAATLSLTESATKNVTLQKRKQFSCHVEDLHQWLLLGW